MPDLSFEQHYAPDIVCGIDEAGRGPLAGEVVAAAVILPLDLALSIPAALNDSKQVSKKNREWLFDWILQHAIIGIGSASATEIDSINILRATHLAMQRAFEALPTTAHMALIDGNSAPHLPCKTHTLIGGDGLSASIAAASIIAKVSRDRRMEILDAQYPHYGFARHQGYGTKAHLDALRTYGACPAHRRSFAPVRQVIENAHTSTNAA